jgi:hypothetical protein
VEMAQLLKWKKCVLLRLGTIVSLGWEGPSGDGPFFFSFVL